MEFEGLTMDKILFVFSGFLFAIGLGISGMTNPSKVKAFLDIFRDWNPSLILVMAGAISVHGLVYFWVRKMKAPIFSPNFSFPNQTHLDAKTLAGSALFGIGWGLSGYCPGPVITSLGLMSRPVLIFFVAMGTGMLIYHSIKSKIKGES